MSHLGSATILVAEDDPVYGASLESLLRLAGHRVRRVVDGVEALRVVEAMGSQLDLLLCDLLLPRRTGFEVIREIVTAERPVKILAITGVYSGSSDVQSLKGLGIAGYLHKSAPFDEILFRVNTIVRPAAVDTRRDGRVAVTFPVEIGEGEDARHATSFNLSASGLYVRTSEPPEEGVVVELALHLPTAEEPVRVAAEVIHAATPDEVRGTSYPAGFGAAFVGPTPLAAAAIRHLVAIVADEERTGQRLRPVDEPVPAGP